MTAPPPEHVFHQIAAQPGAAWLDGGDRQSDWSILTWSPQEVHHTVDGWVDAARAFTARSVAATPLGDPSVPFNGGVLGYLGYGAGAAVETVPPDGPTPEPPVWLARYDGALCFHHPTGTWHPAGTRSFVREARALLTSAPATLPAPRSPPPATWSTVPRETYLRRVQQALAWIAEGDCYQINLSRSVLTDQPQDPWPAMRRLRAQSLTGLGAFLRLDTSTAIVSNSPELLLTQTHDRAVSVPIKGTRPRAPDGARDADHAAALRNDPKERAELTMIVDLVRNDLGRVARPGTVRVGPRTITAHSQVHHASVPVHAHLPADVDPWHTLAALLPYGSVTGAPKVRACERIRDLESHPRGVYCGAIGFVGRTTSSWSVAIRTAVFHTEGVRFHVGGAIVADSNPEAEWAETVHKATALANALGAR